jgi:hypothetical protein
VISVLLRHGVCGVGRAIRDPGVYVAVLFYFARLCCRIMMTELGCGMNFGGSG